MCMCVWVYACIVYAGCGSQRKTLGVLLYHSPPYFLETGSFNDPGTCHLGFWLCRQPASPGNPPTFALPAVPGLGVLPCPFLAFYIGAGHLNMDPHAYRASALLTGLSLQLSSCLSHVAQTGLNPYLCTPSSRLTGGSGQAGCLSPSWWYRSKQIY